jgi:hypothetical protein
MKPNWENAPEWANYVAMDYDGDWWWFEYKPSMAHNIWKANLGRYERMTDCDEWKRTLQSRPE